MNSELQSYVDEHLIWAPVERDKLYFLILGLAGEVGELANIAKKKWRGDDIDPAWFHENIRKELADIGNYTFMLARLLNYDLEAGMLEKLKEVEQRPAWKAHLSAVSGALRTP
jgi:NTP pyrophosphatase (non-canonical NTP hydrolase)